MNEWDEHWKRYVAKLNQEIQYCNHREDINIFSKYLPRDGMILESGCGIGSVCFYLSKKTNAKIIGIDTSSEALKIAERINKNVRFILADVRELPFKDSSFDFIVSLGVIEHLDEPKIAVKEMERVLKNNGVLFISTPNKYCYLHRVIRFFKERLGIWKFGREASFSPSQLKNFLSQSLVIESGYFNWGRKLIFKIFKKLLDRSFLKFGSMAYVIARKK